MDKHEELVASCVLYAFYSEVEHAMHDSDEIMHFGRIGMKWHQHIFGDESRYGKLRNAASKAKGALDSLDRQGDAIRERVNKFTTQTRAEANRWRMDNGYQEDSYKKYHADKAAAEKAAADRDAADRAALKKFNDNFNAFGSVRSVSSRAADLVSSRGLSRGVSGEDTAKAASQVSKATRRIVDRLLHTGDFTSSESRLREASDLTKRAQQGVQKVRRFLDSNPVDSLNPSARRVIQQMQFNNLGMFSAARNIYDEDQFKEKGPYSSYSFDYTPKINSIDHDIRGEIDRLSSMYDTSINRWR